MYQWFSRPDRFIGRCGRLGCAAAERTVSGVPAFMRGLRLLLICDVHARPETAPGDYRALADRAAALKPDLLLLGGDYADTPEPAERLFEALAPLRLRLGSFAVLGNNDREAFADIQALRALTARCGCRLLVNESERIDVDGGALWIAGLDEHRHGRPDPRGLYPERPSEGAYRILLSHYPRPASPAPELILSGHTHGGQFNLLGVTPYAIGFERLFQPRLAPAVIAGQRRAGGCRFLVSKGVGASRIPLRVGVRPEIDLLTFE